MFSKRNAVLAVAAALTLSNFTYAHSSTLATSKNVAVKQTANAIAAPVEACTPTPTVVVVTEAVVAVTEAVVAVTAAAVAVKTVEGFEVAAAPVADQQVQLSQLD